MRFLILAAVAGAVALPTAANAQYYGGRGYGYGYGQGYGYGYGNRDVRREQRECARELRRARNRWEYQRELRECRRIRVRGRPQRRARAVFDPTNRRSARCGG